MPKQWKHHLGFAIRTFLLVDYMQMYMAQHDCPDALINRMKHGAEANSVSVAVRATAEGRPFDPL